MQLRNKVLKIVLSCLAVIPLLLPFKMYADTTFTVNNIVGVNAVMSDSIMNSDVTYTQSGNTQKVHQYTTTYDVEIVFDQAYLGYVQLTLEYNYYNQIGYANTTTVNSNTTRRVYVNGSSVHINLSINSIGSSPSCLIVQVNNPKVSTVTAGSTSMTPIGDLSTLQDILDVLNEINQNIEIDVITELESIVTKLGLANQYLDTLTKLRQWNIDNESLSWNVYLLSNGFEIPDIFQDNYLQLPIYKINNNDVVYEFWGNPNSNTLKDFTFIFWSTRNIDNISQISNYFILSDGQWYSHSVINTMYDGNVFWRLYKIQANNFTNSSLKYITYNTTFSTNYLIPIYANSTLNKNISTEFALKYSLTNNFLDNINIIANGSNSSNNSSNNLESQNTQFSTDSSNLMNLEDTLGNQMNDNLQQIDTNFDVGNQFGSKFLASAEWVRNQYNTITSNTPFGTFISFSLLIGLALLLMGRLL